MPSELYTISGDITLKVDDILDDIIFVIAPMRTRTGAPTTPAATTTALI